MKSTANPQPPAVGGPLGLTGTRHCGLGRRLLAMFYDGVIIIGLLMLAAAAALPVTGGERQAFRDPVYTVYLVSVWFAYLAWCWTRVGQTLGMRAWRVRIRGADGQQVTWRASLVRFAISLLSALACGLGFLWALRGPEKAAWHDLASGTRLVRVDRNA